MTSPARCILIVDDDRFIRRLIAATLQDVTGFELHQAEDGEEALAAAGRCPPAIVFLDMQMPRLDGLATCRALREREDTRDATIVMLTAATEQEAAARAAGADQFLTKPFSPLALLRLVDELGSAGSPGARPPRPGANGARAPVPRG